MKKKAFTLIELLIVITIITLVTSGGVIYFFKQVSSLKLSSEIERVVDIVDKLDSEVQSKKILDYSLLIAVVKNKKGFSYYTNEVGLDSRQTIDFDFESGSGILSTVGTSTGSYAFKIYSGIKFESEEIVDSTDSITKMFVKNQEYKITATLSGNILNNIYIQYYSEDNINPNPSIENYLELVAIKDTTGTISYNSVTVKNINGKKSIIGNNLGVESILDEVYLYFEREGIQKFIVITK